ncbi:MAG: hypothetical protein ACRDI2_08980 [Chloroflexota bacterium]
MLIESSAEGRAQLAALERTVDRIQWRPRNPAVRRALAARTGPADDVMQVKRQELRAAVYLVLAERGRAQAHRFGRSWLTGQGGRRARVVPEQMDDALFWRWFCDEVRKAAEASLLGDAYPVGESGSDGPPGTASTDGANGASAGRDRLAARHIRPRIIPLGDREIESLEDPAPGPLDVLLAQEHRRETRESWRAVVAAATPRQRQLLEVLAGTAACGAPAAGQVPTTSLADAARRLGIAPSTARVQWKRLVERLQDRRPADS